MTEKHDLNHLFTKYICKINYHIRKVEKIKNVITLVIKIKQEINELGKEG